MLEQPVGVVVGEGVVDACSVDVRTVDVRTVDVCRMDIIAAASGGRFQHAMSDQRARAQAFERSLRWQRMRHELMEPSRFPEAAESQIRVGELRSRVGLPAPDRSALS
jgi:hypothetical protein